jgi:hypothetical protein
VDTWPLKTLGKFEMREHNGVYVVGGEEMGFFSDEIAVACARAP